MIIEPLPLQKTDELPLKKNKWRWWVIAIITVAMLLRLVLGVLNVEANDNHIDVVTHIIATQKLPEKKDCWSCYQPKLYYVICVGVIKALNITGGDAQIKTMQLVNVFAGFFILLIIWKFINRQPIKEKSKYLFFALFAFNPCLIGVNVQGSNDTLVIFFGILAVYTYGAFFNEFKVSTGIVLIVALLGAMLTKASGVILSLVVVVVFVIKLFAEKEKAIKIKAAKYFFVLLILIVAIVPFAGGYYHNYVQYGNLSLSTWDKDPPPYFFQKTFITRQGLRSIFDGFFTFRYIDMIRQPYINNEWNNFPEHRTSLWSQIYGRTVFMHFDQWPPTWQSTAPLIVNIGRVLIILGIVPLILFCAGLVKNTLQFFRQLLKKNVAWFAAPVNYIYLFTAAAFLLSSVYYTYTYRDFSSMKSIYIFPGFLAFIKMVIDGYTRLKSKRMITAVHVVLLIMVTFSIADVLFLVYQLH